MKRIYLVIAGLAVVMAVVIFTLLRSGSSGNTGDTSGASTTSKNTGTSITTRVTPIIDTTITINGKTQKLGEVDLDPGTYKVDMSHEGFAPQTRTVTLVKGDNVTVAMILLSNSKDTANWYNENPADAREAEGISGLQSEATANARINALPFLQQLPRTIKNQYVLYYGASEKNPKDASAVTIYIKYSTDKDKDDALNWIRYQGYDPAKLDIHYLRGLGASSATKAE